MSDPHPTEPFPGFTTLIHVVSRALDVADRPALQRTELRRKLRDVLNARRVVIQSAMRQQMDGVGSVPSAMFAAELARIELVLGQVEHLDRDALLYTLGVFTVDGRPGDYVTPEAPTAGPRN